MRQDAPQRALHSAPAVVVRQSVWESRVVITPSPQMTPPTTVTWTNVANQSTFSPSKRGDEYHVAPGEYSVKCVDAQNHESVCVRFSVDTLDVPIVREYCTNPASCDTARDGRVVVVVENLRGGTPTIHWSTGHITTSSVLEGVRPGRYTALVIAVDDAPVMCMHAATGGGVVEVAMDDDI